MRLSGVFGGLVAASGGLFEPVSDRSGRWMPWRSFCALIFTTLPAYPPVPFVYMDKPLQRWQNGYMAIRRCEWCKDPLGLMRSQARFCSDKCRIYAHRDAKKGPKVPKLLADSPRWVRWGYSDRNGKRTKLPLQVNGRLAASNRPGTWASLEEAKRSTVGEGLGFVLGDGIGCIDLDKCVEPDGLIAGWAQEVIDANPGTFTELSTSGTGIHIWGLLPEGGGRVVRDGRNIEVYSSGRYIALGSPVAGSAMGLRPLNVPRL